MLELLDKNEYESAKPFFLDFKINTPILHSILERKSAGKLFTENKSNPTFMLVCSPIAYVFLAGDLDQTSLRKVASYLKTVGNVSLVCPPDWKCRNFFEDAGFSALERVQLQRPNSFFILDSWKSCLPPKYSLKRIDAENFPQCNWYTFILNCYGDTDHFFANGLGLCLMDQGKVVSESYGLFAAGKAEVGVVTDESYRSQNLGTYISAFMLEHCYRNNLEPFWTCNVNNPTSAAIAQKLGFEESCKYSFLKWTTP